MRRIAAVAALAALLGACVPLSLTELLGPPQMGDCCDRPGPTFPPPDPPPSDGVICCIDRPGPDLEPGGGVWWLFFFRVPL